MDLNLELIHFDTVTVLILNALALGCFLSLSVIEELEQRKSRKRSLLTDLQRVARLKRLYSRL